MTDGQPVIQGQGANNNENTSTSLWNSAGGGANGTGFYLFASQAGGDGLYAVAYQGVGVRSYGYNGDGVYGTSLYLQGGSAGVGVRGVAKASAGVVGEDVGGGTGVDGRSKEGVGVRGRAPVAGVIGEVSGADGFGVEGINLNGLASGVGVLGFARLGVWGEGSIGTIGRSNTDYGIGVEGDATARGGIGVFGATATDAGGIGVYATAPNAGSTALQVQGSARFSSSGRTVVPAGSAQVTVAGPTVRADSVVLATLQANRPGVAVRAAVPDPAAGAFTIFLTQAPTTETAVAWFVIN
ncbi:hypothetical protein [Spirillospora sp. NPDC047279]|uniref:hypothetical protein n=1 Tax=Spirillospora sp. NPDC047279 TaxID=3155478 RepID=UPI003407D606